MTAPQEIRSAEIFKSAVAQATATLAGWQRDLMVSDIFLKRCESPLEAAWRVWWQLAMVGLGRPLSGATPHATFNQDVTANSRNYRLDVVINDWCPDGRLVPVLAVELDGHTFHERTPQQVADRNARDRDLQTAGWIVLHFSYAEVAEHGLRCAIDTLQRFDALTGSHEKTA